MRPTSTGCSPRPSGITSRRPAADRGAEGVGSLAFTPRLPGRVGVSDREHSRRPGLGIYMFFPAPISWTSVTTSRWSKSVGGQQYSISSRHSAVWPAEWLAGKLIGRGWSINAARKISLLLCAVAVVPVFLAPYVPSVWLTVLIVGIAGSAHQGWSANLFSLRLRYDAGAGHQLGGGPGGFVSYFHGAAIAE